MRTPDEIRLEIIGLFLERKKWGAAKYREKANTVLESYAKEHAIEFAEYNQKMPLYVNFFPEKALTMGEVYDNFQAAK